MVGLCGEVYAALQLLGRLVVGEVGGTEVVAGLGGCFGGCGVGEVVLTAWAKDREEE